MVRIGSGISTNAFHNDFNALIGFIPLHFWAAGLVKSGRFTVIGVGVNSIGLCGGMAHISLKLGADAAPVIFHPSFFNVCCNSHEALWSEHVILTSSLISTSARKWGNIGRCRVGWFIPNVALFDGIIKGIQATIHIFSQNEIWRVGWEFHAASIYQLLKLFFKITLAFSFHKKISPESPRQWGWPSERDSPFLKPRCWSLSGQCEGSMALTYGLSATKHEASVFSRHFCCQNKNPFRIGRYRSCYCISTRPERGVCNRW